MAVINSTRNAYTRPARRPVTAGVSSRNNSRISPVYASLSPSQKGFVNQLRRNASKSTPTPIFGATNTTNIMAKPEFMELLPLFVQKLLLLDVFGSVAMKSRHQIVPYFKVIAENTKGQTKAGDIMSSPFVNRQGIDPNFTGRVIKNETLAEGTDCAKDAAVMYVPVLPGSVTLTFTTASETKQYIDDGQGNLVESGTSETKGYINYSNGLVKFNTSLDGTAGNLLDATYQYDNENVGPHMESPLDHGQYGAAMGKTYLQLDEFDMIAEAHQLACYWSVYSAFATSQEYGSNLADVAKEAAFSEITAEINSSGFAALRDAATFNPQFNWNAAPVLSGSVVPSDYLNMFKLKLEQASAAIYQKTRLTRPNRLIVGTNVASYIGMIQSFKSANAEDSVGPYKLGTLDQFEIYVDPNYDPNLWVMACKSNDIRRNSALFGEYMPITQTDPITLSDMSVQSGIASMYALKVVNPSTVASGKIVGTF